MIKEGLLVISLSNSVGGAEQCLRLIAKESKCLMLVLFKAKTNTLANIDGNDVKYISSVHLLFGFLMLPIALYQYRRFTIISSHSYLNAVLGILKRVGYLKGKIICRESTSIFIRYKGFKRYIYAMLYRAGYPAICRIICQSYEMADQLYANAPYLKGKIRVVPNPLDFEKAMLMSGVNVPKSTARYICAAGRLIPIKGFDLLIKAFSVLAGKYPDYKLLILGTGPMLPILNALIAELMISEKVCLLGYQSNPYLYFKAAEACVVSSILEGFPNVLLEMMAVNNSIVSTVCAGGIAEIPGIIKVQPRSVDALIEGLNTALEQKTSERAKMDSYLQDRSPKIFLSKIMMESEMSISN